MVKKKDSLAIFSDKPTKQDLLNFIDYSKLLSNVVLNSETPSTIGIFGEWGSGKTSLMLMIEDQLKKKKIKTIWFNAWKYDKEEVLWRALILSILKGLSADQKKIDDTTLKLYEAVSTEKLGQMQIDWLEIGKTLLKGAASIAGIIVSPLFLIPGFAEAFASASFLDQLSTAFTRRKIQQSRERISSIEQFEELYRKLISEHIQSDEQIVILIDDLDRCVPIRSLEVLEALKSFLDAPGCVYIVACDTRLINQGLVEKYDEKSGINIDEYLSKIVQFSFTIPPIRIEDADKFVKNFGLNIGSDDIARLISTTIDRNPRKLKRFLSDLKIKGQLVITRKLLLKPENLVKMSCIAYAWKDFWFETLKNPSIFDRAQKIALSLTDGTERKQEDIEFSQQFHLDDRLYNFIITPPLISDADLLEYMFLSTTTSATLVDEESTIRKGDKTHKRSFSAGQFLADLPSQDILLSRTSEIDKIVNAIQNGNSLILIRGQYGTGKTTLLRTIDQIKNNRFVATYINLSGFFGYAESAESWFYELARLILQSLENKGFLIEFHPLKERLSLQDFNIFIKNAISLLKGMRLVIMIDEYEMLETSISKDRLDRNFLSGLRFLLQENSNLTLILCGRYKIKDLSRPMWSPLSNMVDLDLKLEGLSYKDMEAFLARSGTIDLFEKDVPNYLIEQTGGHPRLLKMILNGLQLEIETERKPGDKVLSLRDVKEVINRLLRREAEPWFRGIFSEEQIIQSRDVAVIFKNNNVSEISTDILVNDLSTAKYTNESARGVINSLIDADILYEDRFSKNIQNEEVKFKMPLFYSWLIQLS
jgi:Cdc6-like AAA superfamily ATPase